MKRKIRPHTPIDIGDLCQKIESLTVRIEEAEKEQREAVFNFVKTCQAEGMTPLDIFLLSEQFWTKPEFKLIASAVYDGCFPESACNRAFRTIIKHLQELNHDSVRHSGTDIPPVDVPDGRLP